ncbi:MAG: hypothetical protein ACKVT1_01185 [Dehalococcoidia bacterium]
MAYTGVPAGGYVAGQLVQTGTAGTSTVEDYGGKAVFAPDGTRLPPGTVIPAGAWISLEAPPPPGSWDPTTNSVVVNGTRMPSSGGSVVTGSQIPLDQANIAALAAAAKHAQDSLAESRRQFDANFQQGSEQAARQYELDKLQLGETQASRQFNERMAQLNLARQTALDAENAKYNAARLELERAQFGASREDAAFGRQTSLYDRELATLGMLADRSGPQDWVKYANLLDGLSAPDPMATQTIDVLGRLNALRGGQQPPGAPQAAPRPSGQGTIPIGGGSGFGGGQPGAPQPNPAPTFNEDQTVEIQPVPDPRRGQPRQWGQGSINSGVPAVVTGDSPYGRTGVEEIAFNPDGGRIGVIPVGQMRRLPEGLPRAASGGMFGGSMTFNRYSPETLNNMPFIQKLRGTREAAAFRGYGAPLTSQRLGGTDVPWGNRVNYRTLMNMNPTELAMTQGLVEDDLGANFDDYIAQSRRAAPFGQTLPVARYGG